MSLTDKLYEARKEVDTIGQTLYEINDIADTLEEHFKNDGNLYRNNDEAIRDILVLKKKIQGIHKLVYGREIIEE